MKKTHMLAVILIAAFIQYLLLSKPDNTEAVIPARVEPVHKPVAEFKKNEIIVDEGYYRKDIPLSKELQKYIYDQSKENNVDYNKVLAIIKVESNFKPDLISSTNDYGLMQINKSNFKHLKSKLGITNFLDPYQNVKAGTYMLGQYQKGAKDTHHALMAYNMGASRANSLVSRGVRSSGYSRKVMNEYDKLKERE